MFCRYDSSYLLPTTRLAQLAVQPPERPVLSAFLSPSKILAIPENTMKSGSLGSSLWQLKQTMHNDMKNVRIQLTIYQIFGMIGEFNSPSCLRAPYPRSLLPTMAGGRQHSKHGSLKRSSRVLFDLSIISPMGH